MNSEELIKLIENGFSQRKIAKSLNTSQTNVRYWLKKLGLKTKKNMFNKQFDEVLNLKNCPKCKKTKSLSDFYDRKTRKDKAGYCRDCNNKICVTRVQLVKEKMVNYKGGKCERCGLELDRKYYGVFEFHHLDSNTKDPNFIKIKYQKWSVIEKELDKCKLLCANCHRIVHADLN